MRDKGEFLFTSESVSEGHPDKVADRISDTVLDAYLADEQYVIAMAHDGRDTLQKVAEFQPDLILLDIMMPKKSGIEVCEILRAEPEFKEVLIIFLTALNDETSHIKGLETGADDYVNKPISPKVLVSRVNALFRRFVREPEGRVLKMENLVIDPDRYEVIVDGKNITLAKKEFELIYLLASRPGRVFLRNEILNQVWGNDVIVGDRTIDVHIRKVRQKLGLDCITTIKGVGYKFDL